MDLDERRLADRKLPIKLCPSPSTNPLPKMPSEENKVSAFTYVAVRRDADFGSLIRAPRKESFVSSNSVGYVRVPTLRTSCLLNWTKPTGCASLRVDSIHHLCRVYEE